MNDQADGLRKLLGQAPDLAALGLIGPDPLLTARATAALADSLARRGAGPWVLDEVPPPTNVAAQFGVYPRLGLGDLALGPGIPLPEEALLAVPSGLRLLGIPGGGTALARLPEPRWRALVAGLDALPHRPEWLLIHADSRPGSPSIALMADTRILITQSRKGALTDAYGLLKSAEGNHPARGWRVLVMNAADADAARRAFASLAATARRFLDVKLELFGIVPQDPHLEQASRRMRPLAEIAPRGAAALAFRRLADDLLAGGAEKSFQWHDFWRKMWLFSRANAPLPNTPAMPPVPDPQPW